MWRPPECTVTGGFFLLVGWFAVSCGWKTALTVLGAAALHELGHLLALRCAHARVRRLRFSALGVVMEVGGSMGYGQELAAALAGPLASLLAAVVLGRLGHVTAAGANAVLCVFNLLPVRPLDGGRGLYLLLAWSAGPSAAEWGCRCVGVCAAVSAGAVAAWLMWKTGGSLWLLPAALWLLSAALGLFDRKFPG